MAESKKYTFKNILVISVWLLLGSGTIVLLIAAITRKNNEPVAGIEIKISGVQNNYFIDKKDVIKILEKTEGKSIEKQMASALDLAALENALQKSPWIKKAEIFFDNNNVLQIKINEREPIARIFTSGGASFYLDSSLTRLPLSDKFSARVPIFTNFPSEVIVLTKKDSLLLKEIKTLGEFIKNDPFWMAQIEQLNITSENTFELVPKLGNQVILFGNADKYEEKFNKLLAFYKQVQTRTGWNRYSILDVQFSNQVVAVNRDAKEFKMDSLRAIQIMNNIIEEAKKRTNDSTSIQLTSDDDNINIDHSPVIDHVPAENAIQVNVEKSNKNGSVIPVHVPEKPVLKNPETVVKPSVNRSSSNEKPGPTQAKKLVKKPEVKKEAAQEIKQVPKAIMPPKSDY